MKANCLNCGIEFEISAGRYNRAMKVSGYVYCGKKCAGIGRRDKRSVEEKKASKAAYDLEYRAKNLGLKRQKAKEYHKRTYNKEKAAIERKKKMPKHIEYCRQPKYKEWKKGYDKKYHAQKYFGEFAEAAIALFELEKELDSKSIRLENYSLINKSQKRKRLWKSSQQTT